MGLEDFGKNLDIIWRNDIHWSGCVRSPVSTGLTILAQAEKQEDALKASARLWIMGSFLSTALQIPIYQLRGVSWSNVGFHLSLQLMLLILLLVTNLSLYLGFRTFKLKASFVDALVLQAVLGAAYAPFFTLVSYFSTLEWLGFLKNLKAANLDWQTAISELWKYSTTAGRNPPILEIYSQVAAFAVLVVSLGVITRLLEALSVRWRVEKAKLFSAAAFGLCFGFVVVFPIIVLLNFTLYSFL